MCLSGNHCYIVFVTYALWIMYPILSLFSIRLGHLCINIKKIMNKFALGTPITNFLDSFVRGQGMPSLNSRPIRGLLRAWCHTCGKPPDTWCSLLSWTSPSLWHSPRWQGILHRLRFWTWSRRTVILLFLLDARKRFQMGTASFELQLGLIDLKIWQCLYYPSSLLQEWLWTTLYCWFMLGSLADTALFDDWLIEVNPLLNSDRW